MPASPNTINIIGTLAGILTTVSFLPQVIRVWKTRSTRDLSLTMFLLFMTGLVLWLVYGILLHSWPVMIANSVTLLLAVIIVIFKLIYK